MKLTVKDEFRAITVLDPHFSPAQTPMRKADFLEEVEDAWRQITAFAVKMQVHAIMVAGDIFHLKQASKAPPWFMNRTLRCFKEPISEGITVVGIGGNHDLPFGSLKYLWNQPLGNLILGGGMHLLDENPVIVEGDGFSVKVAGCSFNHNMAEGTRDLKKEGHSFLVGLGHFWYGPKSGSFFGEPIYGPDYLGQSEVDAFVIGHHHEDQGIPVIGGKTYFVHGSMTRTGMHEGDLKRLPSVGLMSIRKEGIKGTVVRLRHKPSAEIFDLTKKAELAEEDKKLQDFINSLATQGFGATTPEEILKGMPLAANVKKRVAEYLAAAEQE